MFIRFLSAEPAAGDRLTFFLNNYLFSSDYLQRRIPYLCERYNVRALSEAQ